MRMKGNRQLQNERHHFEIWFRANMYVGFFFVFKTPPPSNPTGPPDRMSKTIRQCKKQRKKCHLRFDAPRQVRDRLWDSLFAFSLKETPKKQGVPHILGL